MTGPDDGELRSLQARAYGPHADIQFDSDALRRLRELEAQADGRVELAPPAPPVARASWATWVRRPSVAVVLALVLAAVLVVAGLALLRPAPSDSAVVGARQIARLPIDAGYRAPAFVGGPGQPSSTGDRGFREFHGLRAVILPNAGLVAVEGTGEACMAVYPSAEAKVDKDATGYSGHIWTGCAAGGFPATVQFRVTNDLPADVRAGFPKLEALRFVYDASRHDVVVFAAR